MYLLPVPFTAGAADILSKWSTWSPRPALQPRFFVTDTGLCAQAQGDDNVCGCWRTPLPALDKAKTYRISVQFRAEGVEHAGKSVWALLVRDNGQRRDVFQNHVLAKVGEQDGWTTLACTVTGTEGQDLFLCLYLAWDKSGTVIWRNAQIEEVAAAGSRILRVAAVAGSPPIAASMAEKLAFLERMTDQAASFRPRLVCLPEALNKGYAEHSATFVSAMAAQAKKWQVYICVGLHCYEGARLRNVAVLIDDRGETVGIYRKTHPTMDEQLLAGIAPGDDYPVFDTPIGRIGALICYDYHYPEVTRILGLKGADIICLPNAGDHREGGRYWESVVRTRAIDSQVHIVAAINSEKALIVSPAGHVLAMTGKNLPGVAVADINLDETMVSWSGAKIKGVYDKVRRADSYETLVKHIWD